MGHRAGAPEKWQSHESPVAMPDRDEKTHVLPKNSHILGAKPRRQSSHRNSLSDLLDSKSSTPWPT